MGKYEALLDALGIAKKAASEFGDDAVKVLEKVDSPELATSLKGEARKEYLNALDSVYGDQTKRMADIGFGPETYYHGSKYDVPFFDLENVGKSSGMKESGKAVWLTSKPEVAEQYTHNFPFDELNPNISDVKIRGDFKIIDDLNRYTGKERGNLNAIGEEQGKSGVIFKGIRDNIFEGPLAPGESDIVSVFDPKNIRSTRAAFDPRFKDSPLLMAGGLAGAKVGSDQVDMSPLPLIKQGAEYYEKLKNAIAQPLAEQLNIGKNENDERYIKNGLSALGDPLNYIPGGEALGLIQGAAEFMPKDPRQEALDRIKSGAR